jgi:hypothetical protein
VTDRHTVDSINSDQLDQLYDDLEHARARLGSALACVRLLKIYAHALDRDGQVGSSDVARRIRSILTGLDDQAEPDDLTGYLAPDPPIGCLTVGAASDPWARRPSLAQSGINTPGCDCGHHGMGVSWHGDDCPWRRSVLGEQQQP